MRRTMHMHDSYNQNLIFTFLINNAIREPFQATASRTNRHLLPRARISLDANERSHHCFLKIFSEVFNDCLIVIVSIAILLIRNIQKPNFH